MFLVCVTLTYRSFTFSDPTKEKIKNKKDGKETENEDKSDEIKDNLPDSVSYVTPDNIEDFLDDAEDALIMFYAPCKYQGWF